MLRYDNDIRDHATGRLQTETMPLLEVQNLSKRFPITRRAGILSQSTDYVHAVDGVDLTVDAAETLGLVGESGCGKSTLGRCILRLIEPSGGKVTFEGKDLLALQPETLRQMRREIQMVFQDPFASLNPRMRVGDIVAEPLEAHGIVPRGKIDAEVGRLLDQVGLPQNARSRFPHEFSGGQRQRIGIARALALRPKLIIADEPVSALDVSIRAQILNVIREIQQKTGVAVLFVGHDLGVVRQISRRVAVMYLGKIVELAEADELFVNPRHPYSRVLLQAVPRIGRKRDETRVGNIGDLPSPVDLPSGCRFRTRCPYAQAICAEKEPPLAPFKDGPSSHASACHFAADLPMWNEI